MLASVLNLAIIGGICLLFLIVALIALVRWSRRIKRTNDLHLLDLEGELEKMQREVPNFAAALVILDIAVGFIFRDKITPTFLLSIGAVNVVYLIVLLVGVFGWRKMSKRWQGIQEQLPIQEIRAQMSMQAQIEEQPFPMQQSWQALPSPGSWQDGQQMGMPGQQALPAPASWQASYQDQANNQWQEEQQMGMPGQWQDGQQMGMPGQQNQWQEAQPWQQSDQSW